MTVAALSPSAPYDENGVTTAFAAKFRYLDAAHLVVERLWPDGTLVTLKAGVDYTATAGPTDAGGTVTLTRPSNGTRLLIRRDTPRNQSANYATNDDFPAESHELALDRQMLVAQEQDVALTDVAARALLVPPGVDPARYAGLYPGIDAAGRVVFSAGTGADAGLRTDLASTIGAALIGLAYNGAPPVALDDMLAVDIRTFGATLGDTAGVINTAAINAASAYVSARGGGAVIVPSVGALFPVKVDATHAVWLYPNVRLRGEHYRPNHYSSDGESGLKLTADSTGFMIRPGAVRPDNCAVEGLRLVGSATYPTVATNGVGGIDMRWPPTGSIGGASVIGCNMRDFSEEALIEDTLNSRFQHNVVTDSLLRRTGRTGFAGAFSIFGVDGIVSDNEVGTSWQRDGSLTDPVPWNATPMLAACYCKGGNTRFYNNRWETSEIAFVNEGGQIRSVTDHFEYNASWAWLERGTGQNTIIAPYFNNNSGIHGAGTNAVGRSYGLYASVRKETTSLLAISAPMIIRGQAFLWSTAIDALYDIEDAAGGSGVEIVAANPAGNPLKVWSVDGTTRSPAPSVPPARRENGIANSAGAGAVVGPLGAGGSLPAGWSYTLGAVGVTATVEGVGEDASGAQYVVVAFSGTAAANTNFSLSFAPTPGNPAAKLGDVWTWSVANMVDSLQGTGANNVVLALHEQTATGAEVGTASSLFQSLSDRVSRWLRAAPLDCARASITRTISGATTRRVRGELFFQIVSGPVSFRVKFGLPQLERGASMGQPVITRGAPAIAPEAPGYVAAATGGTTAMDVRQPMLALDPAAPIAGYTVTLPAAPQPGDRVAITTSQTITSLTVGGGSYPVVGAPPTLAAGGSVRFIFDGNSSKWWVS